MCVEEVPLLKQLYEKYRGQGAAFLSVSVDDERKAFERMAKRLVMPWPQLFDGKGLAGEIAKRYRVQGTPQLYVMDRAGRIFSRLNSARELERELAQAVLLSSSAPARSPRDQWQRPYDVMDRMGVRAGSRVADIGAGQGYFTWHLAARVGTTGRVFAVDIAENTITRLRERITGDGLTQVEAVRGETNDPKLPADSLDAVLTVDAYHEFREYEAMLAAIFRALKPGGLLAVIDHSGPLARPRSEYHNRHNIPAELIIEDAARAGFRLRFFDPEFARDGQRATGQANYLLIFEKAKPN